MDSQTPLSPAPDRPRPPAPLPAAGDDLVVDLARDQRQRWLRGDRVRVEDYLASVPGLSEQSAAVLNLIEHERAVRAELGEAGPADEYLARFPHLRAELGARLAIPPGPAEAPTLTRPPDAADDSDEPPPPRLGRYRVRSRIRGGGYGVVYLARDEALGRDVAVKVPHRVAAPEDVEAFLAEARVLAGLDDRGIVPVYDFGRAPNGRCYLVSKYLTGGSLADRLEAGPVAREEAAALVAAAAEALHHAHQRGLVHRDVKPSNILLEADGRPVVADFGLALRAEDVGRGPTVAGTPAYMSPEQARGESHLVDARTDVYSLGVVLYELLTGRRPFQGRDRADLLDQVRWGNPKPPRQLDDTIPRELDRICLKAMEHRAADRYSTALDLAEDLRQWLAGRAGRPAGPPTPPAGPVPEPIVPRGLRSFEPEDADFFLDLVPGPRARGGLPESIRFWTAALAEADPDRAVRVGLLYGPSGCGKSSLVKAGVLPRLAGHVSAVYVEASAHDTEARLAAALRRRWPELPAGPADALAAVRLGAGPRAGGKLVVVLDQFEQWLHAHPAPAGSDLVAALRQCDGARVQALLLVRDDFWMAISRFMRELEVPLREGQNSAAIDRFDPRHARSVLAAVGRAYGALPPGAPTADQERFLELAVAGLADGGQVVPVRLALFAETVKGRPWTPDTWRAVGGAEGVGVAFLEAAFGAAAPPPHRVHQAAARAVLARLLPEPGTDLRGPSRSRRELAAAAGYADRPAEFDELLGILDRDLRLVTAADPEGPPPAGGADDRAYQLTHDYLVPAVRQWLTRKQKETARGRAELRLADRAAAWARRPEPRQLPSAWEWVRMRLLTRPRDWTPAQRRMMRAAARRHTAGAAVAAAAALLIGWGVWDYHGRMKAEALRGAVLRAETAGVPALVGELAPYRRWADPRLRQSYADAEAAGDAGRQLNLSLALLPVDSGQVPYLSGRLFDVKPDDFATLREALAPHRAALVGPLWGELTDAAGDPDRRFRAACALAAYDPDDPRWGDVAGFVADRLATANPLVLAAWTDALLPVGRHLLAPLAALLEAEDRDPGRRQAVTQLYGTFAAAGPPGPGPLEDRLAQAGRPADPSESRPSRAKRQANLAAALMALGRGAPAWPLLVHTPDPTTRSYLIERLAPAGADPEVLAARARSETDGSARRALILALGGFDPDRLPRATRDRLVPDLVGWYRDHPDPGVHAAADWVLRRWHLDAERLAAAKPLSTGQVEGRRGWYLDKDGRTFVVIPGPPGRRVALSAAEVTVADFVKFKADHAYDRRVAPTDDCPVNRVTWDEAAAYCNWLSKREGLKDEQLYYQPIEGGQGAMRTAPDPGKRTGYRLPTEAEWEAAARAGATTRFACGDADDELLQAYAWYDFNAYPRGHVSSPVGLRKPNDWGLFDMDGNVFEWCQDPGPDDPKDAVDGGPGFRMTRGGSFYERREFLGPAERLPVATDHWSRSCGFRPARTLP